MRAFPVNYRPNHRRGLNRANASVASAQANGTGTCKRWEEKAAEKKAGVVSRIFVTWIWRGLAVGDRR